MKLEPDINEELLAVEETAVKKSRPKALLKIAGLAAGILLIYFFLKKSNLADIQTQLDTIGFRFAYLVAIMFISFYTDSIGWKYCFPVKPAGVSLWRLFLIRLAGESLAQINPTNVIAGDTMKAVLLKRDKIPYTNSIVSLTIYRFITILAAVTFIVIGVYVFFDYLNLLGNQYSIIVVAGIIVGLLLFLMHRLRSGMGILSIPVKLINRFFHDSEKMHKTADKLLEIDKELIDFYRTKKAHFAIAYIMSILHRCPEIIEYYLILQLIGIDATLLSCVAVSVGVTVFKALGSFIPGQLGIEEYGNKVMLDFVKISGSGVWLTVSILRRARQIVWIGAGIGAFAYLMRGGRAETAPVKGEE